MMPWCNLRWHLPLPHQSCVLRWSAVFCDVTRLVLGVLGNAMLTWAGVVGGGVGGLVGRLVGGWVCGRKTKNRTFQGCGKKTVVEKQAADSMSSSMSSRAAGRGCAATCFCTSTSARGSRSGWRACRRSDRLDPCIQKTLIKTRVSLWKTL